MCLMFANITWFPKGTWENLLSLWLAYLQGTDTFGSLMVERPLRCFRSQFLLEFSEPKSMLSVRLPMRRISNVLTQSFFRGRKTWRQGWSAFYSSASFHGIRSCLSDRSQKCHKAELIRSLYILIIKILCLLCVRKMQICQGRDL